MADEQDKSQQTVRQLKAQLVNAKLGEEAPDFGLDPQLARQIADRLVAEGPPTDGPNQGR